MIVVTVAVRGTSIASATSPNTSPGRSMERGPRFDCVTAASPDSRT